MDGCCYSEWFGETVRLITIGRCSIYTLCGAVGSTNKLEYLARYTLSNHVVGVNISPHQDISLTLTELESRGKLSHTTQKISEKCLYSHHDHTVLT